MESRRTFALISTLLVFVACSLAQDNPVALRSSLPKVVSASVPFYPELARQTRIQGTVALRVSTDGKRVSVVTAETGHPILAAAAADNVKTWEFKPHTPTNFEVTFRFTLFVPECDADCNCDRGKDGEKESVVLHLPTEAEVSAPPLLTCDPAVEIHRKKSIFARLFHLH